MIHLASGSPRRRALLEWAGLEVAVHPADIDESAPPDADPIALARSLAQRKARTGPADALVVAADTLVHMGHTRFGKPADRADAAATLRRLSGAWHAVTTGVCVRRGPDERLLAVTTEVRFRALGAVEIDSYVASGDADDKAGAYGIQGRAGVFVAELRGSWTNVMGLPIEETLTALEALGGLP